VDDLWATKREDFELIVVQLVSKNFNLCGHDPPMSQTDGQTDGQTTCNRKNALCTIVHRMVKIEIVVIFQQISCKAQLRFHHKAHTTF